MPTFADNNYSFINIELSAFWSFFDRIARCKAVSYTHLDVYKRQVNEGTNTLDGYVTGEGIGRYSEPGRNFRVTLAYTF